MAQIRADEISRVLREEIENYERAVNVAETGSVISVGDGIARIYGLENVMAGELIEFKGGVSGIALNLEEDQVGAVLLGEYSNIKEGDEVRAHGPHHVGSGGRGDDRPRGGRAGQADRRQGPDRNEGLQRHRAHRARRGRPPAGERAAADRHQGHRRDDSDRPRTARADHRRPPDRQDHRRARHHHQSEGRRRDLHLRRHRAEALDRGAGGEDARRLRRDGVYASWWRPPRPIRRPCSTWLLIRAARSANISAIPAATRCAFTTIFRSTPRRIAKFRCCCAVLRDAKRFPATCSIFTAACWSARRNSSPKRAADR